MIIIIFIIMSLLFVLSFYGRRRAGGASGRDPGRSKGELGESWVRRRPRTRAVQLGGSSLLCWWTGLFRTLVGHGMRTGDSVGIRLIILPASQLTPPVAVEALSRPLLLQLTHNLVQKMKLVSGLRASRA